MELFSQKYKNKIYNLSRNFISKSEVFKKTNVKIFMYSYIHLVLFIIANICKLQMHIRKHGIYYGILMIK